MNAHNKNWFYNFLVAHNKLYKLQIGFKHTAPLLKKVIPKMTRFDKEFLIVTQRHFKKEVDMETMRLLSIYDVDVQREILPVVISFSNITKTHTIKGDDHYSNYIRHGYQSVEDALNNINKFPKERSLWIVIAFDAVTNILHHSLETCNYIAKMSPITGNLKEDGKIVNDIVKRDLMDYTPEIALNSYMEYIS